MSEAQSDKNGGPCENTDREIYREPPGDYYAYSIHVTQGGGIGINVGGTVYVKPLVEWHRLAGGPFTPSTTPRSDLSPFQGRVAPFMEHCFGPEISADTTERYHRFIEESLELAQALGCSSQDAHMLVDYTFNRPVGQPHQETGGVMVTLAALCLAAGLDMHAAGEDELRRVWGMIEVIREKQKKKPKGSPLPQYAERTTPSATACSQNAARYEWLRARGVLLTMSEYGPLRGDQLDLRCDEGLMHSPDGGKQT